MIIKEFLVETWLNPRVEMSQCVHNLGSSCVKPLLVEELLELTGTDENDFFKEVKKMDLHYGHFFGFERLLVAISKMYRSVTKDMILTVHGGTGANNMVLTEILEPGDNVVAMVPNYQQHYSIPESLGIEVRYLHLKEENGYLPEISELENLVDTKTRLITMSNPNNPTGSFVDEPLMRQVCAVAEKFGAWVLCDEIYRGLDNEYMPSVVDVYEKGIATCSTSKVFSMAGTRVGWIVVKDKEMHKRIENRRSYDTICDGIFDEWITAIAFEHFEKILDRSREVVNTNRAVLDEWLKTQPRLSCTNKSFSSTAFISFDFDMTSTEFGNDVFEKAGVLICHGDCFDMPKSFRLGYGFITPDKLQLALDALGDYIKTYHAV